MWWRQEDPAPDSEPNIVNLTTPKTIATEIYYIACVQINRHTRFRQESIDIEKSWVLNIGQSGSTYLFLQQMWSMSGWHNNSSLAQRSSNMIYTILWLKRWYITHTIGLWCGMKRGGIGQLLNMMKITLVMRTHCLTGSMVFPDVWLFYMSPPLIKGGIIGIVQRLNTLFKASESSSGRRQNICVRIVRTHLRSWMKYGSTTPKQTITVLCTMCIAHMNFSDKFIIIK